MTFKTSQEGSLIKMVTNNAPIIAKALMDGKDVEIRKTANGISVSKVRKTILVR
jgi:hypothetical protein